MQISEFSGIKQYHDGRPVSDYCNMIPLGDSIIDRHGEVKIPYKDIGIDEGHVIETFVDSLGHIYVARNDDVVMLELVDTPDGLRYSKAGQKLLTSLDGYYPGNNFVTFTESSTKPSQVYICDGANVWYWNTTEPSYTVGEVDPAYLNRYKAFKAIRLPLFKNPNTLKVDEIPLKNWLDSNDYLVQSQDNDVGEYIGFWPDYSACSGGEPMVVNSITWFDNRLVLVEKKNNTVWLSNVDPSRWITPSYTNGNIDPNHLYPRMPWQKQSSESDDLMNDMFPNYYASTASSANIQEVVAFSGQLYFLNDTSIEVWSATGNNSNPIQHNSQNTLYYGGRSPVIINDTLYLICKGAIHNDFIAAISQNGAIQHISNDEIERMLLPKPFRIRPLAVRDQSMVVVYTDKDYRNGYAITKEGRWWRYWNDDNESIIWSVVNRDGIQVGISANSRIAMATENNRTYLNGKPILRVIRGGWMQFTGRKILRELEVVCDTGVYLSPESPRGQIFLRASFDRGITFGPFLYRKFGSSKNNNRVIIWRNCGSGNSMLVEFGTSDNLRFQVYGLRFEMV